MFSAIGRFVVHHRKLVLAVSVIAFGASAVVGGGVVDRLSSGGFDDPGSDSVHTREILDREFDTGFSDLVILLTYGPGTGTDGTFGVDQPDAVQFGMAFTDEVAAVSGTDDVASYWSLGSPASMRSTDGRRAIVVLRIPGNEDSSERDLIISDFIDRFDHTTFGPFDVAVGGRDAVFDRLSRVIESDLAKAEAIAIPLTLLLLVVVFGGIVAALLPVGVGVAAILGAFAVLFGITEFTNVSIFSLNLVTALGLGLAIDYSLFIVSRFREEREAGHGVDDAVVRTIATAGRTIAFSAITVAISLSALLIFPLYFLRSFAFAGIGVLAVAMTTSLFALPALLAILGDRVDSLRVLRRRPPRGMWSALARGVMRHPFLVLVAGVAVLVVVATPFRRVEFAEADDRALPPGDEVRDTSDILRTEFASGEANAFPVVAIGSIDDVSIVRFASELSTLPGVARVDSFRGSYISGDEVVSNPEANLRFSGDNQTWFSVVPSVEPISPEGEALVHRIRELDTPFDSTLVGGGTAALIDSKDAIFSRIPLAGGLIVAATFVLLFLMFGSLLVPLKAIVLNTLSLSATFGMMVWVFQDGHGSGLLNFTATGQTDTTTPILMFCIAFGLSMDYEVFLLSRMKEEYDRSHDNEQAIVAGLEKTGRLVTAAALLLAITFLAFATSGVSSIKLFGIGLAVAVLVDAFIVRVTLVPAFMKLAGDLNWWLPGPLRRVHGRFGIDESGDQPVIDLRDHAEIDLRDPARQSEEATPSGR